MKIDIVVPNMGESVQDGEITEWLKSEGDAVEEDEPIVVIETDKITVDLPAPASGVLEKILKGPGTVVNIGEKIGILDSAGEGKKSEPSAKSEPEATESEEKAAAKPDESDEDEGELSPAVRRLIEENDLDPSKIKGTGKDGRLLKGDVLAYLEKGEGQGEKAKPAAESAPAAREEKRPEPPKAAPPPRPSVEDSGEYRAEERVRMTTIRRRTAERLLEAQNTTASLTTFNDVDLSAIMAMRSKYKEGFQKKYGISLGFMSFFIKASIEALKAVPAANAAIEGEEIVYHNYYDIGVAVSAPRGLVVPVIRNAERLSFAETEQAVTDLATRAQNGELTLEELTGGTFTVSNGGVFGSLLSTPILNPPQSAILGMHRIEKRPIVDEKGEIVVRPMMYLALTYDHRIIDGREAVTCLRTMKERLEDPSRILLEV
ncbi:MAG: 2-oxoglutarate dehydrogenase complex dihydrolipoyllysine-residue succinyltransferase [Deltaproteobacteria bacterium]|nr:2-oxoglutarate dehydrogenase complex dihydrolipoyllysine-residue succinyltransferase [Deltaproteobacteria bacterium]